MFTLTKHRRSKPLRTPSGREYAFKGFLAIDEKKLNAVLDEAFLEWRKRGWLPLIYAHLASLGQMVHLVARHEQRGGGDPDDHGS